MGIPHVELFADALYEIGNSLVAKKDYSLAVKWLERSYEAINSRELDQLTREAVELRLAISQALINAHMESGSNDGLEKAENLIAYMESELGDKLTVLLLRLELLLKAPAEVFDSNAFADVLRRLMRRTDFSDTTFKIAMHHLRILSQRNPALACDVLDHFFDSRVLSSHHQDWVEKAIVFRAQMATGLEGTSDSMWVFARILDVVGDAAQQRLSGTASEAVQAVGPQPGYDFVCALLTFTRSSGVRSVTCLLASNLSQPRDGAK